MKKIGIIPSIYYAKSTFNIRLDINLINFFSKIIKKANFKILSQKCNDKFDIIILSGGNTISKISKKKDDIIRSKLDNYYLNYSLKNNIPIIGICHGAQLLISAKIVKNRKISGYYSVKDDIENAGGIYIDEPAVVDSNIITTAHYKHLGPWMKKSIEITKANKK